MKHLSHAVVGVLWSALLAVPGCATDTANPVTPPRVGIPNPASVNCGKQGGSLELRPSANGGSYGVCLFSGGRECEEWAMFRGECPVGGVPITRKVTKP
jgi:hypothetical protein